MCFVGDDDDIIPAGVSDVRVHVLVKLLDQREDVGLVFGEEPGQMFSV